MIKQVTITNHLGESLTMELRFPEKSGFLIRSIEGLGPSKANINKTELSTDDGAVYNSARVSSRNIVFSFDFSPIPTIEDARQKTYRYFPIKRNVHLLFETDNRICEIEGYVESNEPVIFSKSEGTSISIICPDAYLYSLVKQLTIFSFITSDFTFPFHNDSFTVPMLVMGTLSINSTKTVYYEGDAPVGVILYIHAIGAANNVEITNVVTREVISINSTRLIAMTGHDIQDGDDIIISTIKGNKTATLIRGGVETNILNALDRNPDWFQLERGDNIFTYTADSGDTNLQFKIENQIAYEGV